MLRVTVSEVWQARRDAPDLSEFAVLAMIDKYAMHRAIILYRGKIWYGRVYTIQPELRVQDRRAVGENVLHVLRFASSDRRDLRFRTRSVIDFTHQFSMNYLHSPSHTSY